MRNLMKYKIAYLVFSALLLIPGTIFLAIDGLKLSIDFTGGSVFTYEFINKPDHAGLKKIYESKNIFVESISEENNKVIVRTHPVDTSINNELKSAVSAQFSDAKQISFETVGPSVGQETTRKAFTALFWAMLGILFYMAYAFRNIPKPYSSFRFGASAVIAMLHDALMLLGLFAILGHFLQVEVDALFITAVLTVLGFSVHDTIVVFDRIRENLPKLPKTFSFEEVVNYSLAETLSRSLATSMTVLITLLSLYVLGGETIKIFVLAMLIGVLSGTYSSLFTASPILVIWESIASKKKKS